MAKTSMAASASVGARKNIRAGNDSKSFARQILDAINRVRFNPQSIVAAV